MVKGRFAPSPTGRMHAGNIFAYLASWLIVKAQGGSMVLRIENLDAQRSKNEYIDAVQRDLEVLGLTWDEGPYFQHDRTEAYEAALKTLERAGLVYPCYCSRADLHASSAPHQGEHFVYAGTCRDLTLQQRRHYESVLKRNPAMRLQVPPKIVSFTDGIQGEFGMNLAMDCGDFIVRRSDGAFAYQLAVVVDDAAQGVNSVTRGVDLLTSTPQQIYLQNLLGLPHADYYHVPLIVSEDGRRLSKRDRDASLEELMARFKGPKGVIGYIAYLAGFLPSFEPVSTDELLSSIDLLSLRSILSHSMRIQWRSEA